MYINIYFGLVEHIDDTILPVSILNSPKSWVWNVSSINFDEGM